MCIDSDSGPHPSDGIPFYGKHSLFAQLFGTGVYKAKKAPNVELPEDRIDPTDPDYSMMLTDPTAAMDYINGVHTSARGDKTKANQGFIQINGPGTALPAPLALPPPPPSTSPPPPPPPLSPPVAPPSGGTGGALLQRPNGDMLSTSRVRPRAKPRAN